VFSTCFYTSFLSCDFLSFFTDILYTCLYSHLLLHTRSLFAEIAYQITQVPRVFDTRFLPFYTICAIRCTCRKLNSLLAISSWNLVYSPSLSWTRLSLRNDQPLIASKRRWCSSLRNLYPSNSMSTYRAALEPSPAAYFLDLMARSFFGAISCKDTFVKLVCMKYQSSQQRPNNLNGACFFSPNASVNVQLENNHTLGHVLFYDIYLYTCIYIYFCERNFMIYISTHIYTFFKSISMHISTYVYDGFPLQLLFGPLFLCTNMFKGNPVCQKAHLIVKYLKLKRMNSSIELRELV